MPTLDQWFTGANVFALPFWTLMILFPNWIWTRRVMTSLLPFILLALLYIGLFAAALTSESAQTLSNPTLPAIAQVFSDQRVAAAGWVHYLVTDLFVGRWIYWEGQRLNVWTRHSLALCFSALPPARCSSATGYGPNIFSTGYQARQKSSRIGSRNLTLIVLRQEDS